MTDQRSGPLAAWTSLWLAGQVSLDEVIDAVTGDDGPHAVVGLDDFDDELGVLRGVLAYWRRGGGRVRLVLPVAGDVRGLPGPTGFRGVAIEAGEAIVGAGIGLVPEYLDFYPSSAPPTVVWHAFEIDEAPPDPQQLTDAQFDLATAIRESATALRSADVGGWAAEIGDALTEARRASERLNLPRNFPSRAVAVLSQAERLQAALDLANQDPAAGAYDRAGLSAREAALRPLATAVRRARLAGYNAAAEMTQT